MSVQWGLYLESCTDLHVLAIVPWLLLGIMMKSSDALSDHMLVQSALVLPGTGQFPASCGRSVQAVPGWGGHWRYWLALTTSVPESIWESLGHDVSTHPTLPSRTTDSPRAIDTTEPYYELLWWNSQKLEWPVISIFYLNFWCGFEYIPWWVYHSGFHVPFWDYFLLNELHSVNQKRFCFLSLAALLHNQPLKKQTAKRGVSDLVQGSSAETRVSVSVMDTM